MTTVLFTVSSCFSILNVTTTPPHLPPDYTPSGRSSHLFPSRVRASQACFQPSALPGSLSRLEGPEGHTLCSLPNLGHRETSRPHEHKGLLCPMPSPCLGHGLATRHRASQSSACRGQFGFHTLPTTPGTKRAHRCQEGPRAPTLYDRLRLGQTAPGTATPGRFFSLHAKVVQSQVLGIKTASLPP